MVRVLQDRLWRFADLRDLTITGGPDTATVHVPFPHTGDKPAIAASKAAISHLRTYGATAVRRLDTGDFTYIGVYAPPCRRWPPAGDD